MARRFNMQAFVEEYGYTGIAVYFGIFFGSIGVFYVLLSTGLSAPVESLWGAMHSRGWVESASMSGASTGFLGLSYLITKVLQPFRIGATLALTPMVVRLRRPAEPVVVEERETD